MDLGLYIPVFIFGTILGSFLNVVILRYNTGISFFKGKSRCFSCGKEIFWYELIPVFSFFLQKMRCRKCKSKISWQYPIVETMTGALFLAIFLKFSFVLESGVTFFNKEFWFFITFVLGHWAITSFLIIITVYDIRHFIVPNVFVYSFNVIAFLFLFNFWDFSFNFQYFLSGLAFSSFFALIWLVSRGNWMGLGDAKLALGLGWILGPYATLSVFLLSFWLGAIVGIFLLLFKRFKFTIKSRVPFTPFLVVSYFIIFISELNIVPFLEMFYGA
jgi:leader peptidase (prepilin peptidase)/N-methyltransferase